MNSKLKKLIANNNKYSTLYEIDHIPKNNNPIEYYVSLVELTSNNQYKIIEVELSYNSFEEAEDLLIKRLENEKKVILEEFEQSLIDYKKGRYKVYESITELLQDVNHPFLTL